jgi:hypothetical protein
MIIGELRGGQAGVRERKPVPGMVVGGWVAAVCKVCKVCKKIPHAGGARFFEGRKQGWILMAIILTL